MSTATISYIEIDAIGLLIIAVLAFLYGISLLWICVTVSYLMIYVNVQNAQISTDGLTGINNRREMDDYLALAIRNLSPQRRLGMVLIDIDCFKQINDRYGHGTGDHALVEVARILKQACDPTSYFLARMGGDEFVVIGECEDAQELQPFCGSVRQLLGQLNGSGQFPFAMELSMGVALLGEGEDAAALLGKADQQMYAIKAQHKQQRALAAAAAVA